MAGRGGDSGDERKDDLVDVGSEGVIESVLDGAESLSMFDVVLVYCVLELVKIRGT